jgi:hypothetical protein
MDSPADIEQWKKAQRTTLLAKCLEITKAERLKWNASITRLLTDAFPILQWMMVSFCWPLQGKFDPRCFYWNCLSPKGRGVSAMAICVSYRTYCN